MANVIIRDQHYDKDFVAKWVVGFQEYSDYVKDKPPMGRADYQRTGQDD